MSALTVLGVGAVLLVLVLLGVPILTYFEMQKKASVLGGDSSCVPSTLVLNYLGFGTVSDQVSS